jgi:hypothetical protein
MKPAGPDGLTTTKLAEFWASGLKLRCDGFMKEKDQDIHFAICLNNDGYLASLEVGKLYRIIPDREAESHGLIRVVDESGEDYAFSAERFHPAELPK